MISHCSSSARRRLSFLGRSIRGLHFQPLLQQAAARDFKQIASLSEAVSWLEQWDRGDNRDAYFYLLRRCIKDKAVEEGRRLHSLIRRQRYDYDGFLGNLMIRVYGACRSTQEARRAYDSLPTTRSMTALKSMLEAYIRNDELQQAREFFDGIQNKDLQAWNTMLTAYAEKGLMDDARKLFKTIQEPGVDLWVTMIMGYARSGRLDQAREMFRAAPGSERLWSAIITANAESGELDEARRLLEKMRNPSVASCRPLFDAYVAAGNLREARRVFDKITADVQMAPWAELLNAYLDRGRFSEAVRVFEAMPAPDSSSWNAMIRAHSRRGDLQGATALFERMGSKMRDLSSWNAIMEGYALNGRSKDALKIFRGMKERYVKPDRKSFAIVIDACGELEDAIRVSKEVQWSVFLRDVSINNALLKMFLRLGGVEEATSVFDRMEVRNEESWRVMITGLAEKGQYKAAREVLARMVNEGVVMPDNGIFSGLIKVAGVEEGGKLFRLMAAEFDVSPRMEDYVCMAGVLGKVAEAEELIRCMPFEADKVAWAAFLEVCKKVGDEGGVKVGEKALSELHLEELCVEANVSNDQKGKRLDPPGKRCLREQLERQRRMAELEEKARKSVQEERHRASRVAQSQEPVRSNNLDLEKFWIGD